MLVGSGKHVEKGSLSAVLLPRKGERKGGSFRQRILVFFRVEYTFLTQSRVGIVVVKGTAVRLVVFKDRGRGSLFHWLYLYLVCLGYTKCEGVSIDCYLQGISHRGRSNHLDLGARDDSHIQKVSPQYAFSAYFGDSAP